MRVAELYHFINDEQEWFFTGADTDIEFDENTYLATNIKNAGFDISGDVAQNNMAITVPVSNAIAQLHLVTVPELVTTLTMFLHDDEGTDVIWKGRVAAVRADDDIATLECETIFSNQRQPGLRYKHQKSCGNAVYDDGCALDQEDFAVVGVVDSISANIVTVSEAGGYGSGWFLGGYLRAPDGTLRLITNHTDSVITLSRAIASLILAVENESSAGDTTEVTLYPGCDHTLATCIAKFSNNHNYFGQPWRPDVVSQGGGAVI